MNYYIGQTQPSLVPSAAPTVYLDFPPDLLMTCSYLLFAGIFHWTCFTVTKIIYGH